MKAATSDRRVSLRHNFRVPIRVRIWKSGMPEQRSESENLSEGGILFATDTPILVGTVVEVLLKMPEAITGEPTTEWLCSGHVVRVEPIDSPRGKLGVGMQFDCYQVSRRIEA
jgi:Tfp pilus assembly protein PilZ